MSAVTKAEKARGQVRVGHSTRYTVGKLKVELPTRIILKLISWATETKRVRRDGHVAQVGETNAYKTYSENVTWVFETQTKY
jgi:hypothetical protein